MITIKNLSFPPSVNHYYGHRGKAKYIKAEGKQYRAEVYYIAKSKRLKKIEGRLSILIEINQKDKRRRDLDNCAKCLLDSLQHAGVYDDDSQIDELIFRRTFGADKNHCNVKIKKYAA